MISTTLALLCKDKLFLIFHIFLVEKLMTRSKNRKPAWLASNLCLSNLLKITTPSALCDNKQNQKFFSAILALALATISVTLVSATAPICPPNQGEDEVILLPNPDDCSSYYACNRGTSFLMKCNEGLEFNAELKVCDWPEKAHCHVSPRPSTEPSSTKSSKFE